MSGWTKTETYHFRLFEYNENANTGNHALYQLCGYAEGSETPSSTVGLLSLKDQGIRYYPNPVKDKLYVELPSASFVNKGPVGEICWAKP
ncbi:MAG: hypothetical protein R3B47_17110 [Bacteroidia bacterium]